MILNVKAVNELNGATYGTVYYKGRNHLHSFGTEDDVIESASSG
jgi:hypothetical protein